MSMFRGIKSTALCICMPSIRETRAFALQGERICNLQRDIEVLQVEQRNLWLLNEFEGIQTDEDRKKASDAKQKRCRQLANQIAEKSQDLALIEAQALPFHVDLPAFIPAELDAKIVLVGAPKSGRTKFLATLGMMRAPTQVYVVIPLGTGTILSLQLVIPPDVGPEPSREHDLHAWNHWNEVREHRTAALQHADCVLAFFDLTAPDTLRPLTEEVKQARQSGDTPVLLIGTRANAHRAAGSVEPDHITKIRSQLGAADYIQCSAHRPPRGLNMWEITKIAGVLACAHRHTPDYYPLLADVPQYTEFGYLPRRTTSSPSPPTPSLQGPPMGPALPIPPTPPKLTPPHLPTPPRARGCLTQSVGPPAPVPVPVPAPAPEPLPHDPRLVVREQLRARPPSAQTERLLALARTLDLETDAGPPMPEGKKSSCAIL